MQGTHLLMARLLYGAGLRLMECVRLRVKDLDFEGLKIYVRSGKGGKDRITVFPKSIQQDLRIHLSRVKELHNQDLSQGYGETYLPNALAKKYPNAAGEFILSR
jgi:integrase